MKAIRKGNDIEIRWSIFMKEGRNNIPYILQGKNLTLYVFSPNSAITKVNDFSIDGNVLIWTFKGKEQTKPGMYKLTLVENDGEDGMRTLDKCDAFRLVSCSCIAHGEDTAGVKTSTLELNSIFDVTETVDISAFVATIQQSLTEEQQAQARENIGAVEKPKFGEVYATESYVKDKIAEVQFGGEGSAPDLSDYLKKNEAQETYHPKTTFKTINGESIEGEGNIAITAGNALPDYSSLADGTYVLKGIKSGDTMTLYWSLDTGADTPVTPDEPDTPNPTMYRVIYRYINPDSAVVKPSVIQEVAEGTTISAIIANAPNIQGYVVQAVAPEGDVLIGGDTEIVYVYTSTSAMPEEVHYMTFKYLSEKGAVLHSEVSMPFVKGVEINMPQDIAEYIFDFEGYTLSSISPSEDFAILGETEIVLTYEKN